MVLCARISQAVPHVRSADRFFGRRMRISFNRADDSLAAAAAAGGTRAAVAADGDDSDGGGGSRGAVALAVAGTLGAAADGSRAVGVAASGPPPGIWPRRPAQRSRPARSMLS